MTRSARGLYQIGKAVVLCALLAALLCACAKPAVSQPTPSPAPTATPTPTNTPKPTPTPTPTPEPTPDPAMQSVTYAWLSDTQGYSADYRQDFIDMVQWIVESRAEWNTQYVLHTGDVINDMLRDKEWETATDALTRLNGNLPLFVIAGNHDIKGVVHDYSHFGELLSKLDYKTYPSFGGEELNGRRRYDLVTIGHDEFLLVGVGYSVSAGDEAWLEQVLQAYPERTAILIAHWYLDLRDDAPRAGDAETLYRVVANNPNVRYVLCGHRHNLRSLEQRFDDDGDGAPERSVAVVMADYQGFPEAGGGYVAMMTFDPEKREIRMTAYSPLKDDYNYYEDESRETYTLPLNVVGG